MTVTLLKKGGAPKAIKAALTKKRIKVLDKTENKIRKESCAEV